MFFALILLALAAGVIWFAVQAARDYKLLMNTTPEQRALQQREAFFQGLITNDRLNPADTLSLIDPSAPTWGPSTAPITLVEFLDYDCPFCRESAPIVRQMLEKYPTRVRLIVRDFPVEELHPHAVTSAVAAHCAQDEGKYWSYHDQLYAHQDDSGDLRTEDDYLRYAVNAGLDATVFRSCFEARESEAKIQRDLALGVHLGVEGTPTFFLNGVRIPGVIPADTFNWLIPQFLQSASSTSTTVSP